MRHLLAKAILTTALAVSSSTLIAAEFEVPKFIDVKNSEFTERSHGMFPVTDWKIFDKGSLGGADGVDYTYFYNSETPAYLGIMRYLGETNVENLLVGTLYRAEKEGWNMLKHGAFNVGSVFGYSFEYESDSDKKNDVVSIVYILNSKEENYMVSFQVAKEDYKEGIFKELVVKFDQP